MISTIPNLTNIGKSLLVRAIGGETITFTRFKIGDGRLRTNQTEESLTDLIGPKVSFDINELDASQDGYASLTGTFDSGDITSDFDWRELGLFCKGEDGIEQLYAYANSGDDAGLLPALRTDVLTEQTITLIVAVGDAEQVTALVSPKKQYAEKKDLEDHANSRSNPHNVTKKQVGLSEVENVSPSNMQINFTEAQTPAELATGEKMSALMGKIAAAVKKLIAHIGNKDNPHELTADKIDAAKKDHKHDAGSIETGVLGLERGGTGVTKIEDLKNLIGTNAVMNVYSGDGTVKRLINVGFKPSAVILCSGNGFMGDSTKGVCGGLALGAYGLRSAASDLPSHATTWDDTYTAMLITDEGFYVNFFEGETPQQRIATNEAGGTYLYIAYR